MAERPDDFEQVRAILVRQRRAGASFEQAWQLAFATLARPTTSKADR